MLQAVCKCVFWLLRACCKYRLKSFVSRRQVLNESCYDFLVLELHIHSRSEKLNQFILIVNLLFNLDFDRLLSLLKNVVLFELRDYDVIVLESLTLQHPDLIHERRVSFFELFYFPEKRSLVFTKVHISEAQLMNCLLHLLELFISHF